jgi:hypothetical protein
MILCSSQLSGGGQYCTSVPLSIPSRANAPHVAARMSAQARQALAADRVVVMCISLGKDGRRRRRPLWKADELTVGA